MENQDFLKNLPCCKTLNQKYLGECTAIRIGIWDKKESALNRKIMNVEFRHTDGTSFWADENIMGSGCITTLTLNTI